MTNKILNKVNTSITTAINVYMIIIFDRKMIRTQKTEDRRQKTEDEEDEKKKKSNSGSLLWFS